MADLAQQVVFQPLLVSKMGRSMTEEVNFFAGQGGVSLHDLRAKGVDLFAPTAVRKADAQSVLAVDLDHSLLRSDMLYETFWACLSRDWRIPFVATARLMEGKAAVKRLLAEASDIDVALLPYNEQVLSHIRQWREDGGRAVLVTATNQALAERISMHLGLFDAVYGSDHAVNLKGSRKADLLVREYGARGFLYVGDSRSDLNVWAKASGAVTVDISSGLRKRVDRLHSNATHLVSSGSRMKAAIKAARPHQWLKNVLLFLPMLAAHRIDVGTAIHSIMAFLAFCLIASGVYIFNDLLDLEADRLHIRKRMRPFASGVLPVSNGVVLGLVMLAVGFATAAIIGPQFFALLLGYFVITTAYSLWLKRFLVIDICTLALLYSFRILAGGAATAIPISVWLLAFSIFFFFALAAVKRQVELVDGVKSGAVNATGRGYHVNDLPIVAQMATGAGMVAVLVLALYVNSADVTRLYSRPEALWGICLTLLYWLNRMTLVAHRGEMHDDPVVFAALDRTSQICFGIAALLAIGGALL
ncbi:UbiA family prenyltransferase [Sphingobium chungangianum]